MSPTLAPGMVADYRALRHDVGAVWLDRDVVVVEGPDAVPFLQGQLSQDVAGLDVGASAPSLLLQPQGKVDALVRVTRTATDAVVVDVDGGFGEAVVARLTRFKLRSKLSIEPRDWRCVALRGPGATRDAGGSDAAGGSGEAAFLDLPVRWPGAPGWDRLGPDISVPEGVRLCGPQAWAALRIEAGVPAMGSELDERTIPAEAGVVEETVSFTKGCFTGQELVARLDARGNKVARRLRGVVVPWDELENGAMPPLGAELRQGERVLGSLTSLAQSPDLEAVVALAYVRREVDPPARLDLHWADRAVPAEIRALPLVG